MTNGWLAAGGSLSAIASLIHLACIAGGPSWYRFFGAGERMVHFAERGSIEPPLIALAVALLLAIWAAYACSGAGLIRPLPLLRPALVAICAIYLLRAAALPLMLRYWPGNVGATFLWISSGVVLVFGLVHLIGLIAGWHDLAPR